MKGGGGRRERQGRRRREVAMEDKEGDMWRRKKEKERGRVRGGKEGGEGGER